MYSLTFKPHATKARRKVPKNIAPMIEEKLDLLAKNPYAPNLNVKKIKKHPIYRLRMGDWRIFYLPDDNRLEILVISIESRKGAYKK
jgi:mRNA interferase RelE/StbE